ncbi:peptide-methionine (R)-S-oxide reductase MsrB [Gluconobacter sp. OJB]|uniref:peptide-methionine (R)-S-oxide reductase MsrB n=1 Tax=Gluconobacter sp. OJB TaxID=3145196 RepID=UPI0031F9B2E9
MTSRRQFFLAAVAMAASGRARATEHYPVTHTDAEWHRLLTPAQYNVLREAGTEMPYSSPLLTEHRPGRFACAGCDTAAFDARTKFESGTGWPSFDSALPHAVQERGDDSLGMERTEVLCATCGSHLGHVFDDGPQPTGLRYCMNGVALSFHTA